MTRNAVIRTWMTPFGCDTPRLHFQSSVSYLCIIYRNSPTVHATTTKLSNLFLLVRPIELPYCSGTEYPNGELRIGYPVLFVRCNNTLYYCCVFDFRFPR